MKPAPTLHPELAGAIREVLARATQPLNLAKLRSQLNAPFKVPPKLKEALIHLLESEAAAGRIHEWPGSRYWTLDSRTWAANAMIEAASQAPTTSTKIIASVSKLYGRKPAEALLTELIEDAQLLRIPLFGGSKAKLTSRIADEAAFRAELDAARKILESAYRRLPIVGQPILAAAAFQAASVPLDTSALDQQILDALSTLEPRKGLLVTPHRLYRALPPDMRKSQIDAALLRLQQNRKVILHRHSNAQSLPPEERQSLIDGGGDGVYYVGACWRIEEN